MKPKNIHNDMNDLVRARSNRQWLVAAWRMWLLLLSGVMLSVEVSAAVERPADKVDLPVFATVGKTVITEQDYDAAFTAAARAKFYHGKPPDVEVAMLQRQVGDKLIANVLLLREAKRRGLKPDEAVVKQRLDQYEERYRDNELWQQDRAQALPGITRQVQEGNLLSQLEKIVRNVPDPTDKQLREYYSAHLDKFTAPEQQRVSIILLKVDPSSPGEVWQEAHERGKALVVRLRDGEDFAELAREHSNDPTADQAGDMGYLHTGMLSEAAQEQVKNLKPGEISDAILLMEGVAIFRLTDRVPPRLNKFEDIKERAQGLWRTNQSEIEWNSLIARLKKKATIRVNESRYVPLPGAAQKPAAVK